MYIVNGGDIMTVGEMKNFSENSKAQLHRALFDEYCNYVYAIVSCKLKDIASREDIEECVSDIFAEIFRLCEKNLSEGDLKGLIATVSKRKAVDYYRKLSSRPENISDDDFFGGIPDISDISADIEKKDINRIIYENIRKLGEPDASIIIQQYFYGRTAKEIAKNLFMQENTVHKRCSRARKKLRELLIQAGIDNS